MESRAEFIALLTKVLEEVNLESEKTNPLSEMVGKLFNVQSSEKAFVEFLSVSDLPPLGKFNGVFVEGGQHLGYSSKIKFLPYGLKVVREKELVDDILTKAISSNTAISGSILASDAKGFARAASETAEKACADFWGNLTSGSWDFMESEEGLSVAHPNHTTKVPGVSTAVGFDNLGTDPFTVAALEAAWKAKRQYRSSNGTRMGGNGNKRYGILHGDSLTWKIEEAIMTKQGFVGPDQKWNPAANNRFFSMPYLRLDDYAPNAWTLIDMDMLMDNFYFYNRITGEYANHQDQETLAFIQTYYKRFGLGYKPEMGWRSLYHNNPS